MSILKKLLFLNLNLYDVTNRLCSNQTTCCSFCKYVSSKKIEKLSSFLSNRFKLNTRIKGNNSDSHSNSHSLNAGTFTVSN